jgi:hypothetical protein
MKTFCAKCGRTHPKGVRCDCEPRPKRKPTAADRLRNYNEPWRKNYNEDYAKARQVVIAAQQGKCNECSDVCAWFDGSKWRTAGMGGEVHHKVALCDGGTNEPGNLVLVCKKCHCRLDCERRKKNKH